MQFDMFLLLTNQHLLSVYSSEEKKGFFLLFAYFSVGSFRASAQTCNFIEGPPLVSLTAVSGTWQKLMRVCFLAGTNQELVHVAALVFLMGDIDHFPSLLPSLFCFQVA